MAHARPFRRRNPTAMTMRTAPGAIFSLDISDPFAPHAIDNRASRARTRHSSPARTR
jgi:hypothetical protein